MFGCLRRLITTVVLLLLGAWLYANWSAVKARVRRAFPELAPTPVASSPWTGLGAPTIERPPHIRIG